MGIDASIKNGKPDRAMIEKGMMLADNDSAIILRSLAMIIQDFELSRLNAINVKVVLNEIVGLGKKAE
jgi:hypothetical protein